MKQLIVHIGLLILLALSTGCRKEKLPIPPPCLHPPCDTVPVDTVSHKYEILWHRPFHPLNRRDGSCAPYLAGDVVVTSYFAPEGLWTYLSGFDAFTGDSLWTWGDWQWHLEGVQQTGTINHYGDQVFVGFPVVHYAIEKRSGITLVANKTHEEFNTGPKLVLIGDYMYYGGRSPRQNKTYLAGVFRRHVANFSQEETVFIHQDTTEVHMTLGSPTLFIDAQGDSILILRGAGFHDNPQQDKIGYYALHLKAKQILWSREYIRGNTMTRPPVLHEGRIYVPISKDTYACLDAETGETIWENTIPEFGFMAGGDMLLHEGVLIVCNNHGALYGVNPQNGQVLWKHILGNGQPIRMDAHKGIVYLAIGAVGCNLGAWDVHTGENLWCETSINRKLSKSDAGISGGLTIDHERGVLYFTDGYDLFCVKTIR
jgi:outer membrane protein assembly factor BamB